MKTNTEIKVEGLKVLVDKLGLVEAEKFISLIQQEPFDYTKWQKTLWKNKNAREISAEAMEFIKQKQKKKVSKS